MSFFGQMYNIISLEKYSINNPYRVVTLGSVNSHALQSNQVTLADDAYLAGN